MGKMTKSKNQKISSKLKVRLFFQKQVKSSLHEKIKSYPYSDLSNIQILCDFYKVSPLYIQLKNCDEIDWIGIFFWTSINECIHIFSGGRFGYAGFFPKKVNHPIIDYLPLIEESLIKENIASCSLSAPFINTEIYESSFNGWVVKEITYLVASIRNSVKDGHLAFSNPKQKRNFVRNLKKSKSNEFQFSISSKEKELLIWYQNCHLKRISELSGKKWSLDFLLLLLQQGTGKLALVKSKNNEILGGCFILLSTETLELFMMSTPLFNLNIGVNYFLTNELYIYAWKQNIRYVNWQSSNPPLGGLTKFKKSFNAKEMSFPIYNKIWDKSINIKNIYKESFVFPMKENIS